MKTFLSTISGLLLIVLYAAGEWFFKKFLPDLVEQKVKLRHEKELTQFKTELEAVKEKEIENLKSELNHKTQTAIASLTSQLNIIEAQNNVRFSRIFDKTANTTARFGGDS